MSEALLDDVIEHIADGLSVDWRALGARSLGDDDGEFAKYLRIINDVANLHRADAVNLATEMPTAISTPIASGSPVPRSWGKYRLDGEVGAGSYGAVYRAWDSDLERDVAIKVLHDRFGDTRLKEQLLKEGRALARIRHDNVVRVIGVEAHEDRVALCMEFVKGQTLDEIVRNQGTFSAREAIGVAEDLCRALAAVHRAGYIHRDVKAKNVMRDETGRIVLMDFGTGRMADRPGVFGDRAGTPLYMAPEVLEGEPASASSDVYSLGVLLYHLVSGHYPVEARTIEQLREAHENRRHRWLSERRPDLPVAFMQVVEKAIAIRLDERFANPSELLAALGQLQAGKYPWVRRIAMPLVAVGAAIVGVTAAGALTSAMFNIALQRSDFATDTLWDYFFVWGRRTSFPPFLILLFVVLIGTVLSVVWRLVKAMSITARSFDRRARQQLRTIAHRFRLDEVSVLAPLTLLLASIAVAAAIWGFSDLILALLTVAGASAEELALIAPSAVGYHNEYRWVFSLVTIASVAAWYPAARLVRRGQSIHPALLVGGASVVFVALALLHFPHRLMYFSYNEPAEAVSWTTELSEPSEGSPMRCYVIGARLDETLLFCPALQPPRTRVVKRSVTNVTPLGIRESIFSYFSAKAPRHREGN